LSLLHTLLDNRALQAGSVSFLGPGDHLQPPIRVHRITFSCTGGPPFSECRITPDIIRLTNVSAGDIAVVFIGTVHGQSAPHRLWNHPKPLLLWLLFVGLTLAIAVCIRRLFSNIRRPWTPVHALVPVLCAALLTVSCAQVAGSERTKSPSTSPSSSSPASGAPGSSPQSGPSTYTLTVTGTSESGATAITHSIQVTLVVTP